MGEIKRFPHVWGLCLLNGSPWLLIWGGDWAEIPLPWLISRYNVDNRVTRMPIPDTMNWWNLKEVSSALMLYCMLSWTFLKVSVTVWLRVLTSLAVTATDSRVKERRCVLVNLMFKMSNNCQLLPPLSKIMNCDPSPNLLYLYFYRAFGRPEKVSHGFLHTNRDWAMFDSDVIAVMGLFADSNQMW